MDEIYLGDLLNLSFEVKYPSPIETVELKIEKGEFVFPHECEIQNNIISALVKGKEEGRHIAWFKCKLGDGSIRSFPIDYFVKSRIEKQNGSFSSARKLTEGDNAFQQYDMENRDKNGSSTSPIDIQEPPITMKKNISTMAPKENIGENNFDNEIEYDNPVDKLKKDYSRHGLGAFSTQHQIPGEMSNQISAPEKVDAAVETKKRTDVTNNKEPFFSKDIDDDAFYKSIDDMLFDEEMVNYKKSISVADSLETCVSDNFRKCIGSWFDGIGKSTEIDDALVSLKKSLIKCNKTISKEITPTFGALVDSGVKVGIRKTMVPVSQDFLDSIGTSLSENNVCYAMKSLSDEMFLKASKIIKSYPMGSYKQRSAIDSELKNISSMTKMVIKSKIAEFGNAGIQKALDFKSEY